MLKCHGKSLCYRYMRSWIICKNGRSISSLLYNLENPLDVLNEDILVPVVAPEQYLFKPTQQEVSSGRDVFLSQKAKVLPHRGVYEPDLLPDIGCPEVAFIGQSNAGKSSLIKAIFPTIPAKKAPSVSKTPGHTKKILLYEMKKAFCLVDLPGYGPGAPRNFEYSVEKYLQARHNLYRVFFLVDAAVGMSDYDKIAIKMMEEFSKPYAIVLTKQDTVQTGMLVHNVMTIQKQIATSICCFPQPFLVSAHTGAGLAFLQAFIAYVTGNIIIKGL